ncbi:DUF6239 family natural product biosynthesis protein [Lentzea sp. NPDC058450]|uniref:DUF6239 family natural product biosynthesis protein n=1 Tax=Lentzea sp. NPDC058450 TaxID=3346505 RepID=UPI003663CD55
MHDHGTSVPVLAGPMVLFLLLYFSIPVVAGYALMRVTSPPPRRVDALLVTGASVTAFVMAMMLVPAFGLPQQVTVLLLAGVIVPFVLWWKAIRLLERVITVAPWLVAAATVTALARFPVDPPGALTAGLAAVSWLTFCVPRSRRGRVLVRMTAGTLALTLAAIVGKVATAGGWQ